MLPRLSTLLALIALALPVVAGAWAIDPADLAPPREAMAAVNGERTEPAAASRQVRWHRLDPAAGDADAAVRFLVFQRDRGQRAWLVDDAGRVLERVPRGTAAGGQVGTRGLTVALPNEGSGALWLAIESTLGVFPQPAIEPLDAFIAGERSSWVFDAAFTAALLTLLLLSLAFLGSLRDRMYLAYSCYLAVMLSALWLRHPVAFRHADLLGVEPERIAALVVLAAALGAWGSVELLRVASGMARGHATAMRVLRIISLLTVLLAIVDVATVVAMPAVAHGVFNAINVLFGINALLSATLLGMAALAGGRMARLFLAGWGLLVVFATWFTIGPLLGIPQPANPQRWIMLACAVQGLLWAIALAERALGLQRERDFAQALAQNDPLTGLPNRRALDRALDEARGGVVMLFDLDRFKAINDRFGHAAGDRCLQHFGRILAQVLADSGTYGRYGGEEFLAVVDRDLAAHAADLAEAVRQLTERSPLDLDGVRILLTVSAGHARIEAAGGSAEALAAADRALYRAKESGRNRVEAATPA